ncbi:MAG: alpha/beta fold hydrolase [Ilumatobacteraceae bacterium]
MPSVTDVSHHDVAWREAGDGVPVLLLHGLGGSRIAWEPQLAGLGESFRVAAWDMPGYGESAPLAGETTFDALAAAVGRWADTMDVESFHLCGISMGGMIAQYAAAAHPERIRSLTLLSTSPKFGLDGTDPDQWRARRLAPLDAGEQPADFAHRVLRGLAGPALTEEAFDQQVAAMRRISAGGLRRSVNCLVHHDSRGLLASITAPTLLLVGELDEETPPSYTEALHQRIAGSTMQVVPDAGHLLSAEAPDAVNDAIAAHVTAAEAGS